MKNNNIFRQPDIPINTIDHFSEQQFREMIDSVRASIHPDTYACDGIFIKSFINDGICGRSPGVYYDRRDTSISLKKDNDRGALAFVAGFVIVMLMIFLKISD